MDDIAVLQSASAPCCMSALAPVVPGVWTRDFLCLAKLCLHHSLRDRLYLTCFLLQVVICLMYMAYPQGCQHELTLLLTLRPWCHRLYLKYFLPAYISILTVCHDCAH